MLNKKVCGNIMMLYFFFLPSLGNALCLQNCQQEISKIRQFSDFGSSDGGGSQLSPSAQRNIRAGDVKNSVLGDMNIRVGHGRVDIRTESNSNNNTIDAGINSTIILGDMNK